MPLQQYDVPSPTAPTGFVEKHWDPVNSPLLDPDGEVVGILHQVEDVTAYRRTVLAGLQRLKEGAWDGDEREEAGSGALACAIAALRGADRERELREEVDQLHRALDSRAEIDQAIGMVLAEHPGTPEEAFRRLVSLSQRENVKLRDVARALIARAAENQRPLLP